MKLNKMLQAAQETLEVDKLDEQLAQFSYVSLAEKFDCPERWVYDVARRQKPTKMSDGDYRLMRKCLDERLRLKEIRKEKSRYKIAKRHNVRYQSMIEAREYLR